MRRRKSIPTYSLQEARDLIACGRVRLRTRARRFLREHCVRAGTSKALKAIFDAMQPRHFIASEELDWLPGTYADIYCGMRYDDIAWYVKFYIDSEGLGSLEIWSANWDGAVH